MQIGQLLADHDHTHGIGCIMPAHIFTIDVAYACDVNAGCAPIPAGTTAEQVWELVYDGQYLHLQELLNDLSGFNDN